MSEKKWSHMHMSELLNAPPLIHPDLEKYKPHLPLVIKVMLEAYDAALDDVNQMVANGTITSDTQFKLEFERKVQEHQIRLRGYSV